MKKINITFAVLIIVLFASNLQAQEIKANVIVNMDQLEQERRLDVQTMKQDLENYLNNQKFTEVEWEGDPVPVNIQIYLTGGYNYRYDAQVFITGQRLIYGQEGGSSTTLRIIEKNWSFEYSRGAVFSYNPNRFEALSSLLDFYMLIIIGFDMDTYQEIAGNKVYELASKIQQLGAAQNAPGYSTFDNPGDFTKNRLVGELLEVRFEPFRKLVTEYYMDGLDMMNENKTQAMTNLELTIKDMASFKRNNLFSQSALITAFFHAKSEEVLTIFKEWDSKLIWNDLMYLDPANSQKYEDAQKGKFE